MNRQPVTSSSIASVGYNASTLILEIKFRNDRVYRYLDVNEFMYQEFMAAESMGKFFNSNIKDSYRFERVS